MIPTSESRKKLQAKPEYSERRAKTKHSIHDGDMFEPTPLDANKRPAAIHAESHEGRG